MSLFKPSPDPSPTEEKTLSPSPNDAGDASCGSDPDWVLVRADLQDDHGDEPASEVDGSPEEVDDAAADQLRRDMFYSAVQVGFKLPNVLRQRVGDPPLKSLELEVYGELGRAASDQLHDRLMELPWFARVFGPVHLFAARYGAIFAFGVAMQTNVLTELKAVRAAEAEAAANDEAGVSVQEEPEAA